MRCPFQRWKKLLNKTSRFAGEFTSTTPPVYQFLLMFGGEVTSLSGDFLDGEISAKVITSARMIT